MAGCDGWITIKILELLFATFCMIYKRVTDDEANKLFYFLQKFSREWPLLNNITWEENGAIFTDITYGGYIIIIIGLIIGQCSGELQRCKKLENFFLIMGALLFIAAGSLELAALESVEERLVDNAAILGVFSLLTGFLFIIDLLSGSKRRKKEKFKMIQKFTQSKITQTEEKKPDQTIKQFEMNGNIQNGKLPTAGEMQGGTRIPRNAVKLLPSSPTINEINEHSLVPADYSSELPDIDVNTIKTHEGRVLSTESFLRSEKGLYPSLSRTAEQDRSKFYIPTGYVLVPATHLQLKSKPKSDSGIGESPTPPGYAKIMPDTKVKPSYVVIPVDENESRKNGSRKVQSSIVKTSRSPKEMYFEDTRKPRPNFYRSVSNLDISDISDLEEQRLHDKYHKNETRSSKLSKLPSEYLGIDSRGRKYILQSEDSSDEPKFSYSSEVQFRPDSRHSLRSYHGSREGRHTPKGKINEAYDDKDNDFTSVSRRSSPYRSRPSSPEKPRSILRFDYGRSSRKENELHFPKDVRNDSLDSRRIAEDLRNLREITKSDIDLTRSLEVENKVLKERLKQEKQEKEILKHNLEKKERMSEPEDEKNRRMSEREEQYFGIKDLKQSHRKGSLEATSKVKHLENYFTQEDEKMGKGAKEINKRLKEKYLEHENKVAKEAQQFRDLIDERFHFLNEEENKRKDKGSVISDPKSPTPLMEHFKSKSPSKPTKSDSEGTNYSQSTEEEIKLRVETPGSASYKSEALFWLGNDREDQKKTPVPASPASPGYVLYTAQNWPESPSPEDRFQFSAKEAQHLSVGVKSPSSEPIQSEISDDKKNSQKLRLLEFEEVPENVEKSAGLRKGLLVRKVDFPNEPAEEIKKPATVAGSTSSWKKWLYPKPKVQRTKSTPD